MKLRVLWAAASVLLATEAAGDFAVQRNEVFESLADVPAGWEAIGKPNQETRVRFRLAMRLSNPDEFHQTLNDIANPSHSRYGKHLTRSELKALVQPSRNSSEVVLQWLNASGINDSVIETDGEFVNFVASIGQAEAMMDTTFETFQNANKQSLLKIRTLKYSLPGQVACHVDMIQPTTRFGQVMPQRNQVLKVDIVGSAIKMADSANAANCNATITPQCLIELYKISGFTPSGQADQGFMGVNGFLEEYAQYDDLATWISQNRPSIGNTTFSWQSIAGGLLTQNPNNLESDSVEANLDIQYTLGLVAPLPAKFYSTAGRGLLVPDLDQPTAADSGNEPYLDMFSYLLGLEDDELPHTISTSYGENEQSVPANYSQVVCNMIGQLGARGVSVIFSSGDSGPGSACQTNDGKNTTRFLANFPAACPYVTSVGSTHYVEPESAVSFSSGGFSDRWPRPWWQEDAVESYLEILGDRWSGLYNPQGRGLPDIAAQGRFFSVVDKGRDTRVSGTSASAPVIASLIALLNAARKQAGQAPLGFLNPWLYQTGVHGLTDIITGGSSGCTGTDIYSGLRSPYVPYAGWNATAGWDPVTGLGTPIFDKLLALAIDGNDTSYGGYGRSVSRYNAHALKARPIRRLRDPV